MIGEEIEQAEWHQQDGETGSFPLASPLATIIWKHPQTKVTLWESWYPNRRLCNPSGAQNWRQPFWEGKATPSSRFTNCGPDYRTGRNPWHWPWQSFLRYDNKSKGKKKINKVKRHQTKEPLHSKENNQ